MRQMSCKSDNLRNDISTRSTKSKGYFTYGFPSLPRMTPAAFLFGASSLGGGAAAFCVMLAAEAGVFSSAILTTN